MADEQWCEDEKFDPSSDLKREWERRKEQFHAIGYRDGLIAGKEDSAQIGFNEGFKESVVDGFKSFNWGVIRGVTGALDCIPSEIKEKLIESKETRSKLHDLFESVNHLSTKDALNDCGVLGSYSERLQSLIVESPTIALHLRN